MFIVVMGVCGCGKTTVGQQLADQLGVTFWEGDKFHCAENIAKMSAGIPLNDTDRAPWLKSMAEAIAKEADQGAAGLVLACSALKRKYRDVLRQGHSKLFFVYLQGDQVLITKRMAERKDHYMPASLIESQFAALEEPQSDELHCVITSDQSIAAIVEAAQQRLRDISTKHV